MKNETTINHARKWTQFFIRALRERVAEHRKLTARLLLLENGVVISHCFFVHFQLLVQPRSLQICFDVVLIERDRFRTVVGRLFQLLQLSHNTG